MNTIACSLLWALLPLLVLGAVIAWATETSADWARRRFHAGWSQRAVAASMGVSRHRVRAWAASAAA